jgi:hypothetical protein
VNPASSVPSLGDPVLGYRDPAMAAHGRILQLEKELADRGGRVEVTRARSIVTLTGLALVAAIAIPTTLAGAVAVGSADVHQGRVAAITTRTLPREPTILPTTKLTWYEPAPTWSSHPGPWVGVVSGEELIVGLMWRRGTRNLGLHAAAFERTSLRPRWIAGPFPSTWIAAPDRLTHNRYQLVVQDDAVIIADAEGTVRVLELASGAERDEIPLRHGTEGACIDGRGRTILGFASLDRTSVPVMFPWELEVTQPFVLDLAKRKVTPTKHGPLCTPSPYCADDRVSGPAICRQLARTDTLPPTAASLDRFETSDIWEVADRRVALGKRAGSRSAIGWSVGSDDAIWETTLESPGRARSTREPAVPTANTTASSRTLYHGYASTIGAYRILALAVESGALRFSVDLPGSNFGTRVDSMTVDGDDLFVVANDELIVLDARSGHLRGRLEGP